MIQSHLGELAALLTAVFWTVTSLVFEAASRRIGSLTVNILRLYLAFLIYTLFTWITRGLAFPLDASRDAWIWLTLSGLVGFVIGDQFLFQAFVLVGARVSMLVMALVPPITAIIGWAILGETLSFYHITGMALTITGVSLVVIKRQSPSLNNRRRKLQFSYPVTGVLFAFGGAVGQAVGLVLSKYGMKDYNAFAASQIRVLAGMAGFTILFFVLRRWKEVWKAFGNQKGMINLSVGSLFGPFLGVSFSLLAVQHTHTGIASTIMAIVPVLIIPPAILLHREKVSVKEIIGAFIAVAGVAMLFMY
ncbi:MAG: DMT family transporter [Bacteroidales bacterium]|nr:DMT family transporter [Bacteroidales bacterium]